MLPSLIGIIASSAGVAVSSSYESISTVTLGSSASSITFSSIPSTYSHLQVRCFSIGAVGNQDVLMYFNGVNSSGNYAYHELKGDGSSASSSATTSAAAMFVASNSTNPTNPTAYITDVLDYANTNKNKTIRTLSGKDSNGSGNASLFSGVFLSTNAISSITIYTPGSFPFNQYSSFALYGIKG